MSAARTWTESSAAFAPPATAIEFSPASSTTIRATPVASSGSVNSPATSTPSASSAARAARPERVVTDRADEEGPRPEPGGGHRLVAALAAVVLREPAADDGLALAGQPLRRDDEVLVDRADDDDPTGHLRTP